MQWIYGGQIYRTREQYLTEERRQTAPPRYFRLGVSAVRIIMKRRMMTILLVSALAFTPVLGITVSAGAEDMTEQTLEKKAAEVKSENASGQDAGKEIGRAHV